MYVITDEELILLNMKILVMLTWQLKHRKHYIIKIVHILNRSVRVIRVKWLGPRKIAIHNNLTSIVTIVNYMLANSILILAYFNIDIYISGKWRSRDVKVEGEDKRVTLITKWYIG